MVFGVVAFVVDLVVALVVAFVAALVVDCVTALLVVFDEVFVVVLLEVSPLEELSTFLVVLSVFDELSFSKELDSFFDDVVSESSLLLSEELDASSLSSETLASVFTLSFSELLVLPQAVASSIDIASEKASSFFSIVSPPVVFVTYIIPLTDRKGKQTRIL